MILKLKTAPLVEPVDPDEIKSHLRLDTAIEDTLLESYLKAARQHVESLCGPLITQTWLQYEEAWPSNNNLSIGNPRLQSVAAVKYTDDDGTQTTLDDSTYTVATEDNYRPAVVLYEDESWPSDGLWNVNPIEIEFVCGFGDSSEDVPEPIRLAILLLVANWYENREPVYAGVNTVQALPFGVEALLANYRIWGFGS